MLMRERHIFGKLRKSFKHGQECSTSSKERKRKSITTNVVSQICQLSSIEDYSIEDFSGSCPWDF